LYATLHATIQQVEAVVNAISNYAIFAEYNEDQYAALVNETQEALTLLQAVTAGKAPSPAWLTQRDDLIGRTRALIDDQRASHPTSQEGTTPP
jgi:hypothetical protein